MSRYRLVGAAIALAVMTAPAMAQQVISEPGYCAFFYPNANCQNKGPGNPYTDPRRFNQGYSARAGQRSDGRRRREETRARIRRHPCSDGSPALSQPSLGSSRSYFDRRTVSIRSVGFLRGRT